MILEIFFAAGCFWGVEKNFENIEGVVDVVSGYSGGNYENPTYQDVLNNRRIQSESFLSVLKNIGLSDEEKAANKSTLINHTETVKVIYDTDRVSTETLLKNFWEIHDPTQLNRQVMMLEITIVLQFIGLMINKKKLQFERVNYTNNY